MFEQSAGLCCRRPVGWRLRHDFDGLVQLQIEHVFNSGTRLRALRFEKVGQSDSESVCNLRHDNQTWIALSTLNSTDIGQVNVGFERQFFLRQASVLPSASDVRAESLAPILHRRMGH
jgi:hypothetical protein